MSDRPDNTVCRGGWAMPPSSLMIQAGNNYYTCSICGERCDDKVHDFARKGGESATVSDDYRETDGIRRDLAYYPPKSSIPDDEPHQILDDFYGELFIEALPKAKAAIQAYARKLARERLERVQAMAEDLLRDTSLHIDSNSVPAEIVRRQKRKREARLFNDALLEVNEIIKQELESL